MGRRRTRTPPGGRSPPDGQFTPVVVCGRDEGLRQQVADLAAGARGRSVIIGWTDEMPALMAGCDALVENAGGLTSLEALRAGLPVVSFQPIAGHGRENTARMAEAGVSRLARDAGELQEALQTLTSSGPARTRQVEAGRAMFRDGADRLTLEAATAPRLRRAASGGLPGPGGGRRRRGRRPRMDRRSRAAWTWPRPRQAPAWLTLKPAPTMVAYVGVRLNASELADPDDRRPTCSAWTLTAIVDSSTALSEPRGGPDPGCQSASTWRAAAAGTRRVRATTAIRCCGPGPTATPKPVNCSPS